MRIVPSLRPLSLLLLFSALSLSSSPGTARAEDDPPAENASYDGEQNGLLHEAAFGLSRREKCDAINDKYPNGVPAEACLAVPGCRVNGGRGKHICVYDPDGV